jgi:hypothetical protein
VRHIAEGGIMRKILAKETLASTQVARAIALDVFSAAPPSASTGSGCNYYRANGHALYTCISASGSHARPNVEVEGIGPNCSYIAVYTGYAGYFYDEVDHPCTLGWHNSTASCEPVKRGHGSQRRRPAISGNCVPTRGRRNQMRLKLQGSRKHLIGLLSAAILVSGVVVPLSAAPAFAASCYGATCTYKDPIAQGCSNDAVTIYTVNGVGAWGSGTLQLRYSYACGAAWAKVYNDGCCTDEPISIQNSIGDYAYQFVDYWGGDAYTDMVDDVGSITSQACMNSSTVKCTNWW